MRNPRLLVRGRVSLTRTIVVNQRGERINPTVFIYLQILHQLGSIFSQHRTIKHKNQSIIAGGSTFDKLRESQQLSRNPLVLVQIMIMIMTIIIMDNHLSELFPAAIV